MHLNAILFWGEIPLVQGITGALYAETARTPQRFIRAFIHLGCLNLRARSICLESGDAFLLHLTILVNWSKPLTCGDRINSVQYGQYHGCWCPGSLCSQDISMHGIDYVEYVISCLTWERISATCVMSVKRNDIQCKYMFCSHWKNLSCKGSTCVSLRGRWCGNTNGSSFASIVQVEMIFTN